jgi:spartin
MYVLFRLALRGDAYIQALSNVAEKTYATAIEPGVKAYENTFGDKPTSTQSPISPSSASANAGAPAPPYQPRKPGFPRSPSANQVPAAPSTGAKRPPPPIPARRLEKVAIPNEKTPIYSSSPSSATSSAAPTPTSKTKRPLLNRIMLAGEVVLTSLEATAHELINTGTAAASTAAG